MKRVLTYMVLLVENLVGKKFGRLTVISRHIDKSKSGKMWKCRCECGKETLIFGSNLKRKNTMSCGCLWKETIKNSNTKHGLSNSKFYKIYRNMLRRLNEPNNDQYKNYGARGIKCCFKDFGHFRETMYYPYLKHVSKYGDKNTTLERKNVNGNYSPENCTWATMREQQNNRRDNHWITFNGKTLTMIQWSRRIKMPYQTLARRINISKWPTEKALTSEIREHRPYKKN